MKHRIHLAAIILFAAASLAACQPGEIQDTILVPSTNDQYSIPYIIGTPIPFESIRQSNGMGSPFYEGKDPLIVVLTEFKDIERSENPLLIDSRYTLKQVDFDNYFVLAVFQGWKGTDGYNVDIITITKIRNQILVYTAFKEPLLIPDFVVALATAETSPYHIIAIPKEGLDGELIINLISIKYEYIQRIESIIN